MIGMAATPHKNGPNCADHSGSRKTAPNMRSSMRKPGGACVGPLNIAAMFLARVKATHATSSYQSDSGFSASDRAPAALSVTSATPSGNTS